MPRVLGVIPARFASSRFPGKPLASLGNRSLIEQVWSRVNATAGIVRVVIATDDRRIVESCRSFGAEVRCTSPDHPSGTDRVGEVVRDLREEFDVVVNVQGDEPFVTPSSLDRLVACFATAAAPQMATLAEPIEHVEDLFDPNVVKVVTAADGRALYFSRSPIPYARDPDAPSAVWETALRSGEDRPIYLKHQGIYAFSVSSLLDFCERGPSALERREGLEQLRALEAGWRIHVVESDFRSVGVDTPEDLERAVALLGDAS